MTRLFISLAISFLISGCQTLSEPVDFSHPKSKPPVGTIVQLNEKLTFQTGTSRSYIQHGKFKEFKGIEDREPWCMFYRYEPRAALKSERSVEPDNFTVTSSLQRAEMVSAKPFFISTFNMILPAMLESDNSNSATLTTTMKIKSDKQPEVVELRCGVFNESFSENYVSVNKILETLGNIVTLKFPQ